MEEIRAQMEYNSFEHAKIRSFAENLGEGRLSSPSSRTRRNRSV